MPAIDSSVIGSPRGSSGPTSPEGLSVGPFPPIRRGHAWLSPGVAEDDNDRGTLVHPQFWPEDLDYAGKIAAIIGSGDTAVTLAKKAAHVYQVQRSPTYVMSRPGKDEFVNRLRRWLPERLAYSLTRWQTTIG